jgi:exosortase
MLPSPVLESSDLSIANRALPSDLADRRAYMVALAALSMVLFAHASTLVGLMQQWWSYLNHGYVLIALVVWVCWRDRGLLIANASPWWPGAGLVVVAEALWFIGSSAGLRVLEQVALLAALMSWALGNLGLRKIPLLIRMGGYVALALPAWGLITPVLQHITVLANSVLLAVVGLKANITGTYIAIPEGTFEVAGSCAGVSFFLSGLTVAVAYWEISSLTTRGRWLALSLMVSLSLVSNWVRVFLLILIGHWTKMQSPLIADHGWFGWLLFAMMVIVFLVATRYIEARHSLAGIDQARAEVGAASEAPEIVRRFPWLAFTALAVIGPLALVVLGNIPQAESPAAVVGLQGGANWRQLGILDRTPGGGSDVAKWAPGYRGADRHQTQSWAGFADTIQVDRLIFSGRDHKNKLFSDANTLADRRTVLLDRVVGIGTGTSVRTLRQALVRVDSTTNRAVFYWFRIGETSTGLPMVGRAMQVKSALTRGAPSELVAVSAPCTQNCEVVFAALQRFIFGEEAGGRK